mmetsp:Transcript_33495/g.82250  ORF Transcript_33495/g.82250 Transcript_33495/m.82250 type:complete len:196 (-) Transcript_33495:18-605(-)
MLRRVAMAVAPRLHSQQQVVLMRGGDCATVAALRQVSTATSTLDKAAKPLDSPPAPAAAAAAARREAAERDAAKVIGRMSSPLFSHVEVHVDDSLVIPRWANVLFVAGVAGVFGYFAQFAYHNEQRKSQAKERAKEVRETRAQVAIDSGVLRDHGRRNFAMADESDDPFDGLSPEEITKLAEVHPGGGAVGNNGR